MICSSSGRDSREPDKAAARSSASLAAQSGTSMAAHSGLSLILHDLGHDMAAIKKAAVHAGKKRKIAQLADPNYIKGPYKTKKERLKQQKVEIGKKRHVHDMKIDHERQVETCQTCHIEIAFETL